jgi:hypothetical protein
VTGTGAMTRPVSRVVPAADDTASSIESHDCALRILRYASDSGSQ